LPLGIRAVLLNCRQASPNPQGIYGRVLKHCYIKQWREMLLASGGWNGGMSLHILRCREQSPQELIIRPQILIVLLLRTPMMDESRSPWLIQSVTELTWSSVISCLPFLPQRFKQVTFAYTHAHTHTHVHMYMLTTTTSPDLLFIL
jgi:hypothetical protein